MSNAAQKREMDALAAVLNNLRSTYDGRMLFMALIGQASVVGERVIAAGLLSQADVQVLFNKAMVHATTARDKPVAVAYADGGSGKVQ